MTRIDGSTPQPIVPAPKAAAVPAAAAPEPRVQPAAEPHLAPAQLGALDQMMQAFLADGKLSQAELQAYQAARASFQQGGWDGVPLPDDDDVPAGGAAPVPAAAAPAGPDALPAALAAYRNAITQHDQQNQGYAAFVFSGLGGGAEAPVNFPPGLMIPHGVRVLTAAALNREPTADEMESYRKLMDTPSGMAQVVEKILSQAPDRAAAVARLKWSNAPKVQPTAEDLARQAEFDAAMRRLANQQPGQPPVPAPAPKPAPPPAPQVPLPPVNVAPADYAALRDRAAKAVTASNNPDAGMLLGKIDGRQQMATLAAQANPFPASVLEGHDPATLAVVGGATFFYAGRPDPGLLGGWDNAVLGKTYTTADPLYAAGGYNDLHYYPECQDPAYKAIYELIFAANKGDKAAWTELARIEALGYDHVKFVEERPSLLASPEFAAKQPMGVVQENERIASLVLQARDRWKAGGTQVTYANDPQLQAKTRATYAEAVKEYDLRIAAIAAYLP